LQRFLLYFLVVINLITFLVYFVDKQRARQNVRRVPEKYLHLLELFGGTPAAFVAHRWLRHKNKKLSYQLVFYTIVSVQVILFYFWVTATNNNI